MTNQTRMSRSDAEKTIQLLEGFSLLLRSSMPERLFDVLNTLDGTGVYEPLRYGPVMGPTYVADEADVIAQRLRTALADGS